MDSDQALKVSDLPQLLQGSWLAAPAGEDRALSRGYACDLLSWVMAHAEPGTAWITVQNHMNVIAVASLMDFACVILPEGVTMAEDVRRKAEEEGVPVLRSGLSAYRLSGLLSAAGLPG